MTELFGTRFSNPVLMAAGTCGFGEPVVDVLSPSEIGGLVTKSVTVEPRWGNPAPRVAEFEGGMLNSVGLANPGLEAVRAEKLPWMRRSLDGLPVFVSVAGTTVGEYAAVVSGLEGEEGFLGFELNLSCPNDSHLGGRPFCLDPDSLRLVLDAVRPLTDKAPARQARAQRPGDRGHGCRGGNARRGRDHRDQHRAGVPHGTRRRGAGGGGDGGDERPGAASGRAGRGAGGGGSR